MLHYIQKIVSIEDYTVKCLFNTGELRTVSLKNIIEKYLALNDGLISQLADPVYFRSVKLDTYGTLTWDNGVDFDPDNLYHVSEAEVETF